MTPKISKLPTEIQRVAKMLKDLGVSKKCINTRLNLDFPPDQWHGKIAGCTIAVYSVFDRTISVEIFEIVANTGKFITSIPHHICNYRFGMGEFTEKHAEDIVSETLEAAIKIND